MTTFTVTVKVDAPFESFAAAVPAIEAEAKRLVYAQYHGDAEVTVTSKVSKTKATQRDDSE